MNHDICPYGFYNFSQLRKKVKVKREKKDVKREGTKKMKNDTCSGVSLRNESQIFHATFGNTLCMHHHMAVEKLEKHHADDEQSRNVNKVLSIVDT